MSSMALSLVCAVVLAMACTSLAQPQDYVAAHNTSRALVGVGPVSWSSTIANSAQNYANQRVDDCALTPSGSSYGENLFWSSDAGATAADAVASWVSEEPYYDYNTNQCQSEQVCTHYTQVVWSASTSIGCGRVACNNDAGVVIICYYYPAGNIVGERPY